jgi:transposase-like protein
MSHANARLTPAGRVIMVSRIRAGRPVAHVAAEMGVSRTTAWRWWGRFLEFGPAGSLIGPAPPALIPLHRPRAATAGA